MPLWKDTDSTLVSGKPLFANTDPHMDLLNVIAKPDGWNHRVPYTDMHSNVREKDEILVAIRGLSGTSLTDRLGQATITDVRFSASTGGLTAVANVIITFNERVTVVGANTLTIDIGQVNATASALKGAFSNVSSTYVSGTGTNRLRFNFTSDANAAIYTIHTASIGKTASLALVDTDSQTNTANLDIVSDFTGANSAVGTLTTSA